METSNHRGGILQEPSSMCSIFCFLFFTGSFIGKTVQDFRKMLANQVDLEMTDIIFALGIMGSVLLLSLLAHVNMYLLSRI